MLTAQREAGYKNIQLNAGVFLYDFDPSTYKTAAEIRTAATKAITDGTNIIGMTRGGGSFSVTKETRSIEADGKRNEFVGSTVIDSVDAKITATLLEFTPENMKLALTTGEAATSGNVTTIKMRSTLQDSDYIAKLCWVGERSDGAMIAICFDNALNNSDFEFSFSDKAEGTTTVEFHAYQSGVTTEDYAPFAIYILSEAA